ncbi:MAG: 50S ribosomal protein L25 [Treponema sp.]|jgi:large subunit ribosomal protein L25|nr:50S ribosomal protein L25 [Treponema sp.]
MDQLVIKANTRTEAGKRFAKRLRESGRLPAVMYNSKGEAVMLDIDESEFIKVWNQATPTTLINLDVAGSVKKAFIKDTEYNIIQDRNLHVDFQIIDEDKPLKATMKIIVSGNPVGVREGGVFQKGVSTVDIECMPKDLPVRIVADVNKLGLGKTVTIADLPFDKSVKVLSDKDVIVAQVIDMRV